MLIPSEQSEQIAQVAQDKWATVSHLLRSPRRNERLWANWSGHSPKMSEWANRSLLVRMAHSLTFFWQKTVNHSEIWWAHSQPCLQCDYVFEFAKRFYFSSFLYTVVGINLENYLLLLVLLRKNKDHFNKEKDFVLNIPPLIPIKFLYIVCTL